MPNAGFCHTLSYHRNSWLYSLLGNFDPPTHCDPAAAPAPPAATRTAEESRLHTAAAQEAAKLDTQRIELQRARAAALEERSLLNADAQRARLAMRDQQVRACARMSFR